MLRRVRIEKIAEQEDPAKEAEKEASKIGGIFKEYSTLEANCRKCFRKKIISCT